MSLNLVFCNAHAKYNEIMLGCLLFFETSCSNLSSMSEKIVLTFWHIPYNKVLPKLLFSCRKKWKIVRIMDFFFHFCRALSVSVTNLCVVVICIVQ